MFHKDVSTDKYSEIRKVLLLILLLNISVSLFKIIYGNIAKSISMTADGFHSLSDGASNIIGLLGIWIASKPVDNEHPYGHKKFETFTALAIVGLLATVAVNLAKDMINRISNPVMPVIDSATFTVMIGTLAVNIFVVIFETAKGKQLGSDFLVSDAMHTKSDIYISLSVISGFIGVKLGLPWIDIVVALVIIFLIMKSAFEILFECATVLCDGKAIEEKMIMDVVLSNSKVVECHKIRSRGRNDDIHIDLHVNVDKNMTVIESHCLSHELERNLKEQIPGVSEVVIHVEPV